MTITRDTPKKRSVLNSLSAYPVGPDGNMVRYLPPWDRSARPIPTDEERGVSWKVNVPFKDTLTLEHIFHGQSAANFIWRGVNGLRWHMFLADVEELMVYGSIVAGQASGLWQMRKRGQNYGLAMAPELRTK